MDSQRGGNFKGQWKNRAGMLPRCLSLPENAQVRAPSLETPHILPWLYSACPSILNPCPSALWCLLTCSRCPVKVAQLCPTLCDPVDYMVNGILQARILECVAFPFSRGSSQPRDRTQVSRIAGRFCTSWATREALGARVCHLARYTPFFMLPSHDISVFVCYSLIWATRLQTHWEQGCDHACVLPSLPDTALGTWYIPALWWTQPSVQTMARSEQWLGPLPAEWPCGVPQPFQASVSTSRNWWYENTYFTELWKSLLG